MHDKNKKNIIYLSLIRGLACIAICVMHTFYSAYGVFMPGGINGVLTVIVKNIMLWAVPCFLMVSGALLLDPQRQIGYRKLFGRYIRRMVLALIVFTAIFHLLDTALTGEPAAPSAVLIAYVQKLITGGSWAHMWYLYMMIAIYLLLPFYRMIAERMEKTDGIYLLGVWFVFISVMPLIEAVSGSRIAFYVCTAEIYPFYLFAGYMLHKDRNLLSMKGAAILTFIGLAGMIFLSVYTESGSGAVIKEQMGHFYFPITVLQGIGIYRILREAFDPEGRSEANGNENHANGIIYKLLLCIDRNSFGIYLLHLIPLRILFGAIGWNPFSYGGIAVLAVLAVLNAAVSCASAWVLKRLPGFRAIL